MKRARIIEYHSHARYVLLACDGTTKTNKQKISHSLTTKTDGNTRIKMTSSGQRRTDTKCIV